MTNALKHEIDIFVRDVTSVGHMPKSQVRSRLKEILDLASEDWIIQMWEDLEDVV